MDLINPFEPVGKAQSFLPQTSTRLRALVKTGGHLGHGLDLKVVRHSGNGGKKAGLERFGKGSVERGLGMVAAMKPPTSVPKTGKTASRVVRGNMLRSAQAKSGSINFGDASSQGRRVS